MKIEELVAKYGIQRSIMATVKEAASQVKKRLPKNIDCLLFDGQTPLPFKLDYKTPATLGADRKAAVAGAMSMFPGKSVLVIDAGTCITYDYADAEGNYKGGAISPGLHMRLKALHNFTARLPLVEAGDDVALIGTSTEECIRSGVLNGISAEAEGIIARYRITDPGVTVVTTGGDAGRLQQPNENNNLNVPNLVLAGLNSILEYNV